MHLSGLFLYPVKSLRGCPVASAELDALGLVGDRRFLVVDESGRFLTQRTLPRMALIATALDAVSLTLTAAGASPVRVPRASDPGAPLLSVSVWKSDGLLAEDCGDPAAAWLSDFLGQRCRLVRIGEKFLRPILKPGRARPGDVVAFTDAYPFLVIAEASLAGLNDRLLARGEEPLPMDRFRPNLVIAGPTAHAEDGWPHVQIGGVILRAGGPCVRCVVTTTNQLTAERGKEPLRTLSSYRRDPANPSDVTFGQNFIHETKAGRLRLGDPVTALP